MRLVANLVALAGLALPAVCMAEQPSQLYVLAIGNNGLPSASPDPRLRPLRYADDDAAAFAQFARDLGGQAILLSNLDADTTRRFPRLALRARPPTREELQRAVRELNASVELARRAGIEPVVLLTYSGHGVTNEQAPPALTLADGELTQQALYSEVLSMLKARFIHVVVDACHAEAVVRPRDIQAEIVPLTEDAAQASLAKLTLRGLPNVGALIASSASSLSHEWDDWQQGVFTHEVLSGLRGAADVNGDLNVEYSEMAAFLSAVNREVGDPGARIRPLVTPPSAAPRAPIVQLGQPKRAAFLVGHPGRLGGLWIETASGQRIADLRSEQELFVRLLVPGNTRLFVRNDQAEAQVIVREGQREPFDDLTMRRRGLNARGSLDLSLERGLFAAAFGPAYYSGFVDNATGLDAVPLSMTRESPLTTSIRQGDTKPARVVGFALLGVAGASLLAAGGLGIAALNAKSDFEDAHGLERASLESAQDYDTYSALAIGALITGVVSAGVSYVLFSQD